VTKKKWLSRRVGGHPLHPETLMMGYGYDPFLSERSLKPPVFHTSTFVFKSARDGKEFFELAYGLREKRPNEEPGLIYSRINNPDLEMRTILGTMCDPQTTWMLMRSLETMKLRMDAATGNARKVAEFLRAHQYVKSVWYLAFLPEKHPDRTIFERQCKSAGSTFSFEVKGGETEAFAVLDHLEVIKLAVSLGGTESLASHPASMTHSDISADERARLGITPSLIRLSVGIENSDDLIADLDQALASIS